MRPSHASVGVLAVDSGGSGLRAALAVHGHVVGVPLTSKEPVRTGPRGIDAGHLLEQLLPMARELMAATGTEELGPSPSERRGSPPSATLCGPSCPQRWSANSACGGSRWPRTR